MTRRTPITLIVALVLSLVSLCGLFLTRQASDAEGPLGDAELSVEDLGRQALEGEVRAEVVTSEQGTPELILYAPTSSEQTGESRRRSCRRARRSKQNGNGYGSSSVLLKIRGKPGAPP
ncbi:MAG: hypothetical protein AAFX50_11420, partial [Acidobacteriota bacterium]